MTAQTIQLKLSGLLGAIFWLSIFFWLLTSDVSGLLPNNMFLLFRNGAMPIALGAAIGALLSRTVLGAGVGLLLSVLVDIAGFAMSN